MERFGETIVEHFHGAVLPELDVRGLQVSVDHARFMARLECIGDLMRDGDDLVDGHRPLLDPLRERGAFDELENERVDAVRLLEP